MKPDLKIKPAPWMVERETRAIMQALNHNDVNALFVGGCIRNELMRKPVKDLDIACKLTPEETIEVLENANIKTIPTGIKYGTVTAIMNRKSFEITTLRSDVNTDGRHADVAFGVDWADDAKRRDFTINALYADMDGRIFDPLGTGLDDIQKAVVRFIGDADARIQEDYLRILRFFRFYGRYGTGTPDTHSFESCAKFKDKISTLSNERISDELTKIISDPSAGKSLYAMHTAHIFDLTNDDIVALDTLITHQDQLQCVNIYARIFTLKNVLKYFNNNKLNSFIKSLDEFIKWFNPSKDIATALYLFGRDITVQGLLILKARGQTISDVQISMAMSDTIKLLPIGALDIMHHFKIGEGKEVGEKLKQGEQTWLESGMTLKAHEILERI